MGNSEKIQKQKQLLQISQHKTPTQEELDDFLVEILASALRNIQKEKNKKN